MTTIAVFGGSGKIGREAVGLLGKHGHPSGALVHQHPVPGSHVTCVEGSVVDPAHCSEVVRGSEIVIQLATTKEDSETFFDVSLRGTFNILEACRVFQRCQAVHLAERRCGAGNLVYPHPQPITEETPLAAYPGYYAFSKVMEETMTRQYQIQYGLRTTILRSSWVFEGDDLLNHFSLLKNVNPSEPGHGFGKVSDEVLELVRSGTGTHTCPARWLWQPTYATHCPYRRPFACTRSIAWKRESDRVTTTSRRRTPFNTGKVVSYRRSKAWCSDDRNRQPAIPSLFHRHIVCRQLGDLADE